jgi:hypothetical protein
MPFQSRKIPDNVIPAMMLIMTRCTAMRMPGWTGELSSVRNSLTVTKKAMLPINNSTNPVKMEMTRISQ